MARTLIFPEQLNKERIHIQKQVNSFKQLLTEKDRMQYYVSFTLRMFGQSLYFIFIPALLLNLNYTIKHIGVYYLIWTAAQLITTVLAGKITYTKGIRAAFALGTIPLTLFLFTTPIINSWLLFSISALAGGMANALFWTPYHQYLSLRTKTGTRGRTITGIATMAAPAIGGILLDSIGSTLTLGATAVIAILALIPLWMTKNVKTKSSCSFKEIYKTKKEWSGFFATGLTTAGAGMLWPLAFYIILKGYTILGIITFATSLIALLVANIAGWKHDKKDDKKVLKIGAYGQAITLFARLAAINPIIATIVDTVDKMINKVFWIGVDSQSYKLREKDENAIVKREVAMHSGIFILFLFLSITGSLTISFIIAGLSSIFVTKI